MISKKGDAKTLSRAEEALAAPVRRGRLRRLLPFLGPAFIASIAYMDPGNFATNISGGAQFGYMLLWVILASNLIAMLVQTLSAKLGIASGKNLAEQCRENFSRPVAFGMWILAEIVAMATDLAEFLGAALGFYLLLGVPLLVAGLLTAVATFLILSLERFGFRPLEAAISGFVGIIAVCYVVEVALARPPIGQILFHLVVPELKGSESVLIAVGILGATVMPHAIYLHSSLTQNRVVAREPAKMRRLIRFEIADVTIAMGIAGFVNMAMLVMAGATFFAQGLTSVGSLEEAHKTLEPLLGKAASLVFGVSLLASGLSSSTVGTMAGQVIMQGFVRRRIPAWIRRLATMVPSLAVIAIGLDPSRTLVISQVVLSFGLPFAIIPLVMFTRRRDIMGALVNRGLTTAAAAAAAALIVVLNLYLLYQTFAGG
jgi:manganese transport protein